jgi:quercetin dioxygenase-like cupin family protein
MDSRDRSPLVMAIGGKHSLLKPPFSERLRSGSVVLDPGEEIGEHRTDDKEEAIIVLHGTATVICEEEKFAVGEKQFAYIPRDKTHNVLNETDGSVEYVYITTSLSDGDIPHDHHH